MTKVVRRNHYKFPIDHGIQQIDIGKNHPPVQSLLSERLRRSRLARSIQARTIAVQYDDSRIYQANTPKSQLDEAMMEETGRDWKAE